MATSPVKSQPLHNFPLSFLKWGGTTTANNNHPSSNHHRFRRPKQLSNNHETDDESADNKKRHRDTEDAAAEAEETIQKPWNLRPRRQPVVAIGAKNGNGEVQEPVHPVAENNAGAAKSLRVRGDTAMMMMMQCGERKKELKKNKFWIALSKEEIEEDIFVMTGSRPNRRPKKRPKNVQKQMDSVFPGLWLLGVSADDYKVEETPSKVLS